MQKGQKREVKKVGTGQWGGISFSQINTTMGVTSVIDLSNLLLLILSQEDSTQVGNGMSGQGHLLTLTVAALRYSLTPQTLEDQTTSEQRV